MRIELLSFAVLSVTASASLAQTPRQQPPTVQLPTALALKLLKAAHRGVDDAQATLDRETALYDELYAQLQQAAQQSQSPPDTKPAVPPGQPTPPPTEK